MVDWHAASHDRITAGIRAMSEASGCPEGGTAASKAIMTTDTVNKEVAGVFGGRKDADHRRYVRVASA